MSGQPVAGDGQHQACDQCGIVAPFADLDMQYSYGIGVEIECRDGAACKARRDAPTPNRLIDNVVDALAALGISANADDDLNEDDDFCGLSIDPRYLIDSDAEGMHVGWDADNGWTFTDWCDPPTGGDNTSYLDPADPAGPREVAERVKAILDGTVTEFRAACVCYGDQKSTQCSLHGLDYVRQLLAAMNGTPRT
jgi:hypothetical protein